MLDPSLSGRVTRVIDHDAHLTALTSFCNAVNAAVSPIGKATIRFEQSRIEGRCVGSGQVQPSWIGIRLIQRQVTETGPGAIAGIDLVEARLQVVPAQL